jgi:hypothetical protein
VWPLKPCTLCARCPTALTGENSPWHQKSQPTIPKRAWGPMPTSGRNNLESLRRAGSRAPSHERFGFPVRILGSRKHRCLPNKITANFELGEQSNALIIATLWRTHQPKEAVAKARRDIACPVGRHFISATYYSIIRVDFSRGPGMTTVHSSLAIAGIVLTSFAAQSQTLPPDIATKVDKLFDKWNKPDSLGCALGVYEDGGTSSTSAATGWPI